MAKESNTLASSYSKLDWATSRHAEMHRIFSEFARPGEGDKRPYGIKFRQPGKPHGLVVARLIMEQPLPTEMSLLAADLIHNARVALDHTLASLKARFGGNPGSGSFPVCQEEADWQRRVLTPRNKPLAGLIETPAFKLIYDEQPLHRLRPEADPLVILNKLDNADKHRMMHPAFFYTGVEHGSELIEVLAPSQVIRTKSQWTAGQPLEHGSTLATFLIRGPAQDVLRAHHDAPTGFASGDLNSPRTGYIDMLDRVRGIVDKAAALIDAG